MVKYTCLYCKKIFDQKWNHSVHIKSCEIKFNEIINNYKSYTINGMIKEYTDIINNNYEANKDKIYRCKTCNKKYNSYNGLKRHITTNGCKTTNLDICDKIMQKYNATTNNTVNNTNSNNTNTNITSNIQTQNNNTQNNNNYNINNNIKLIPYDDIKYDYMRESVLRKAFEVPGEAFQSITTDTFFDPENKENHVIYCPNLKDNEIHVFNGNKFTDGWDVLDKKKFFAEMLTKQMRTLEKIFRCNEEDDNPLEIDNIVGFTNLLKEFNKNNDVIKEYTNILNTICYKNNPIIKNTIDKSKESRVKAMLTRAANS